MIVLVVPEPITSIQLPASTFEEILTPYASIIISPASTDGLTVLVLSDIVALLCLLQINVHQSLYD